MTTAALAQTTGASTGVLVDQITHDALRRASMAPTYMEALDITGAALIAVAYLVKVGVKHV
ncbi:hypothetical protein [Caballeronia sp. M23-90]